MERPINLCDSCIHRHRLRGRYAILPSSIPPCNAFLTGIPVEVWNGADHRGPLPGDGGLQYQMRPGSEDVLAAYENRKDSEEDVSSALGD